MGGYDFAGWAEDAGGGWIENCVELELFGTPIDVL